MMECRQWDTDGKDGVTKEEKNTASLMEILSSRHSGKYRNAARAESKSDKPHS